MVLKTILRPPNQESCGNILVTINISHTLTSTVMGLLHTSRVVGQIAAQIGPYNLVGYQRHKKLVLFWRNRTRLDTRANYKHLSALSSDLPLSLYEYPELRVPLC